MYESKRSRPLSTRQFARRLAMHVCAALSVIVVSLAVGMLGYVWFEGLTASDAFLNASMLLGGMGPVTTPDTDAGKLFAGLFSLYAGLVFLVVTALILTPIAHRLLHRFHWDSEI